MTECTLAIINNSSAPARIERSRLPVVCGFLLAALAVMPGCRAPDTQPANKQPREISFRLNWFAGGEHAFLYYGKELGLFEKAGVNLTILSGKGSSTSAKLIGSGNEDMGLVSSDYVLIGSSKGLDLKSFMTLFHQTPVTVYSLRKKNITKLTDLYGKRLGVMLESNTYPQWQGLCKLHNIDRTKITELPVKGETALRMVLNDEIDAHTWYTNNGPVPLRLLGHEVNEILAADNGIDMYGMSFVVGPRLMNDKDTVLALKKAILESLQRAHLHPEEAIAALQRAVKLENGAIELAKLEDQDRYVFTKKAEELGLGYQNVDGWKQTAETLVELGQIEDASIYKRAIWGE